MLLAFVGECFHFSNLTLPECNSNENISRPSHQVIMWYMASTGYTLHDVFTFDNARRKLQRTAAIDPSQAITLRNRLSQLSVTFTNFSLHPDIPSQLTYQLHVNNCIQCTLSNQPNTHLMPMKGFVHEVLCRPHTSDSVPTAHCYLEAICQLIEKEKNERGCPQWTRSQWLNCP